VTFSTHRVELAVPTAAGGVVEAVRYTPERPIGVPVLLAPGAGGSLDSEPLVALADAVARYGHPVVRVNLVHHQAGRRAPRAQTAVPGFREILAATHALLRTPPDAPWILGGRSYGGRVASLAVAAGTPAAGLLFSGYPLHPPGKPDRLRVDHWPNIGVPCLFIQGDHDPLADLALLRTHRRKLPRRSELVVVPGGDHALRVTGARSSDGVPRTPTAALATVAPAICRWLADR
jgi:uncharacterized protein